MMGIRKVGMAGGVAKAWRASKFEDGERGR